MFILRIPGKAVASATVKHTVSGLLRPAENDSTTVPVISTETSAASLALASQAGRAAEEVAKLQAAQKVANSELMRHDSCRQIPITAVIRLCWPMHRRIVIPIAGECITEECVSFTQLGKSPSDLCAICLIGVGLATPTNGRPMLVAPASRLAQLLKFIRCRHLDGRLLWPCHVGRKS